MKINWKVRIKNKLFWIAVIPAALLVITDIASLFGLTVDMSMLNEHLISIVKSVFGLLTILGIVADPTTEGINDSERAMTYTEPYTEED